MEKTKAVETNTTGRLVATCWLNIAEALKLDQTQLLSLPNLAIDIENTGISKSKLSFIPCISSRLTHEALTERGIGSADGLEGDWELKPDNLKIKAMIIRFGEEDVLFIDRYTQDDILPESADDKAKLLLKQILECTKEQISCNYAKYFVNNSLIISEKKLSSPEASQKIRAELYSYINENIKKKIEEKTDVEQYLENFELRPFYGPTIQKLPTFKPEFNRYDWDDLYINVEQTKQELNIR